MSDFFETKPFWERRSRLRDWCRFAVCWWHTFNGQMGTDPGPLEICERWCPCYIV